MNICKQNPGECGRKLEFIIKHIAYEVNSISKDRWINFYKKLI